MGWGSYVSGYEDYDGAMERMYDGVNGARVWPGHGTMFTVHVDTKNGTEIPPALQRVCAPSDCTFPQYGEFDVREAQPSVLESLQEEFVSRYERISRTYTQEETRDMLCRGSPTSTLSRALLSTILSVEPGLSIFLAAPGASRRRQAERHLIDAHELLGGELLLRLVLSICDVAEQ